MILAVCVDRAKFCIAYLQLWRQMFFAQNLEQPFSLAETNWH